MGGSGGNQVRLRQQLDELAELEERANCNVARLRGGSHRSVRPDQPPRPRPRHRIRVLVWAGIPAIATSLALFPWIAAIAPGALAAYAEPAPPPRSQVVAPAAIATQASQPPAERVSATPTQTPATPHPTPTPPPVQGSPTPAPLPVPTTPPLPIDAPKAVPTAEATESPKPKNCLLLCPPGG